MAKLESSLKNMVLSLSIIALVASALLGLVYAITKAPIEKAEKEAQQQAISDVLPTFDKVDDAVVSGKTVHKAYKGDEYVGVAVETETDGFGGTVKLMVGFDKEGNITGYSVLKHSETPGLGSKMPEWFQKDGKGNVIGKNPLNAELKVSKDGGDVDAITAATISSRAFLKGVNEAAQVCTQQEQPQTTCNKEVQLACDENQPKEEMTNEQ